MNATRDGEIWNEDEIRLLGTKSDAQVALDIGRTKRATIAKRVRLGIAPWMTHQNWTRQEIEFLARNAGESLAFLARALQRSKASIRARLLRDAKFAQNLGVSRA